MGQYWFAGWRMSSSVVVRNAAGGRAGWPPGAWAVGRPTLHGGPVWLRPVRATPCFSILSFIICKLFLLAVAVCLVLMLPINDRSLRVNHFIVHHTALL